MVVLTQISKPDNFRIMSSILQKYEERLSDRYILSYDGSVLKGHLGDSNPKFFLYGKTKPFFGLTCTTRVVKNSELFHYLCNLQTAIMSDFKEAEIDDIFSFLKPESFHMTVCDIVASTSKLPSMQLRSIVQKTKNAFMQVGTPGEITTQIKGIGLKTTITIIVRFLNKIELRKIIDIEQKIKRGNEVDNRDFAGHISLAYFVKQPAGKLEKIKEILSVYSDKVAWEYSFSKIHLTCFVNMNRYIPLLTLDLNTGEIKEIANIDKCETCI